MKKILVIIFCFISIFAFASKEDLYGSWSNDKVVYTFTNDSLYIDEIGNEGNVYTWYIKDNSVNFTDCFNDTDTFTIINITKTELSIKFSNDSEIYTFVKK